MKCFAYYKFEFGFLRIEYENNIVFRIDKTDNITCENKINNFSNNVYSQIREYLDGNRKVFNFNYELIGTQFQRRVWAALCKIPYGETRSYKQIAEFINNIKAFRAVGMANNRNPISIVVPCHRVIGANGSLVGYGGGLEMKKFLLDIEKNKR